MNTKKTYAEYVKEVHPFPALSYVDWTAQQEPPEPTLKEVIQRNLDDPQECADFLAGFGHLKGARLARSLSLSGPGSIKAASDLLNYAQLKQRARAERLDGRILSAVDYDRMCDMIYVRLPPELRW